MEKLRQNFNGNQVCEKDLRDAYKALTLLRTDLIHTKEEKRKLEITMKYQDQINEKLKQQVQLYQELYQMSLEDNYSYTYATKSKEIEYQIQIKELKQFTPQMQDQNALEQWEQEQNEYQQQILQLQLLLLDKQAKQTNTIEVNQDVISPEVIIPHKNTSLYQENAVELQLEPHVNDTLDMQRQLQDLKDEIDIIQIQCMQYEVKCTNLQMEYQEVMEENELFREQFNILSEELQTERNLVEQLKMEKTQLQQDVLHYTELEKQWESREMNYREQLIARALEYDIQLSGMEGISKELNLLTQIKENYEIQLMHSEDINCCIGMHTYKAKDTFPSKEKLSYCSDIAHTLLQSLVEVQTVFALLAENHDTYCNLLSSANTHMHADKLKQVYSYMQHVEDIYKLHRSSAKCFLLSSQDALTLRLQYETMLMRWHEWQDDKRRSLKNHALNNSAIPIFNMESPEVDFILSNWTSDKQKHRYVKQWLVNGGQNVNKQEQYPPTLVLKEMSMEVKHAFLILILPLFQKLHPHLYLRAFTRRQLDKTGPIQTYKFNTDRGQEKLWVMKLFIQQDKT